jgi:hypothetical protein
MHSERKCINDTQMQVHFLVDNIRQKKLENE